MSLTADALQPFIVTGLFSLNARARPCNLSDVITESSGRGYYLTVDAAQNTVEIDFYDAEYLAASIGGDAYRLSAASFLTLSKIGDEVREKPTLAWSMIKLYYAAFYSGHSILRILGEGCSYLGSSHTGRVRALASAAGSPISFGLTSGLYFCRVNRTQTGIRITPVRNFMRGTHESFWRVFGEFFDRLTEQMLMGHLAPADAAIVFAKFNELRKILRSDGSTASGWLSSLRNELQYRHGFEVWYPGGMKSAKRESISRMAKQWERDPMEVDIHASSVDAFARFVGACAFIVALNRVLFFRIAERSSEGSRSFANLVSRLP